MAQALKIYQYTQDFIAAFRLLKETGAIQSHRAFATSIGISPQTLSNILYQRGNIRKDALDKFRKIYPSIKIAPYDELREPAEEKHLNRENPPGYRHLPDELTKLLIKQNDILEKINQNMSAILHIQYRLIDELKSNLSNSGNLPDFENKAD